MPTSLQRTANVIAEVLEGLDNKRIISTTVPGTTMEYVFKNGALSQEI